MSSISTRTRSRVKQQLLNFPCRKSQECSINLDKLSIKSETSSPEKKSQKGVSPAKKPRQVQTASSKLKAPTKPGPNHNTFKTCSTVGHNDENTTPEPSGRQYSSTTMASTPTSYKGRRQKPASIPDENCPPFADTPPLYRSAPPTCERARTKQALVASQPSNLIGRQDELFTVKSFIEDKLASETGGSLYISGAPGTGKTACLQHFLSHEGKALQLPTIFINCMELSTPQRIYGRISSQLLPSGKAATPRSVSQQRVEKMIRQRTRPLLLILDEIDQLSTAYQEVLYSIFAWPSFPGCRLILIGIANALDLTDRMLPRLQAHKSVRPQILHFTPYTPRQLVNIIEDRLNTANRAEISSNQKPVIETTAVVFCARKVGACSGDARKALDICRRAVELKEGRLMSSSLKSSPNLSANCSVLKESDELNRPETPFGVSPVTVADMAGIVTEIYGSRSSALASTPVTNIDSSKPQFVLPLQQKLLVCGLLFVCSKHKCRETTLDKLYDHYVELCKGGSLTPVDFSETTTMVTCLDATGIFSLKPSVNQRLSKVALAVDENEVLVALRTDKFTQNVLNRLKL